MRRFLLVGAIALTCAMPALADKVLDTSIQAIDPGGGVLRAGGTHSSGFEPAQGFAPGWIGGQAGWTTFASSTREAHVATGNPFAGTQNLRISLEPTLAPGALTGGFSPQNTPQPLLPSFMSVELCISNTDGADYDVVPQAPSQGLLTARVKFFYLGDIYVLDNVPGTGLTFVDTGVNWVVGQYRNLTINVDPLADTINYFYGGSLIYSSQGGVFAGTTTEQVVLMSDNWQLDGTDAGDFDNLLFTPEPSTLGLLALAGLLGIRRRR